LKKREWSGAKLGVRSVSRIVFESTEREREGALRTTTTKKKDQAAPFLAPIRLYVSRAWERKSLIPNRRHRTLEKTRPSGEGYASEGEHHAPQAGGKEDKTFEERRIVGGGKGGGGSEIR